MVNWKNYFSTLSNINRDKDEITDVNGEQFHDNLIQGVNFDDGSEENILNSRYRNYRDYPKFKYDKAAGIDNLIGEFFKSTVDLLLPQLNKIFNHIYNTGIFPSGWAKGIILLIYKKGNTFNSTLALD